MRVSNKMIFVKVPSNKILSKSFRHKHNIMKIVFKRNNIIMPNTLTKEEFMWYTRHPVWQNFITTKEQFSSWKQSRKE